MLIELTRESGFVCSVTARFCPRARVPTEGVAVAVAVAVVVSPVLSVDPGSAPIIPPRSVPIRLLMRL